MSYIGSTPTTQSFTSGTDYFNGTGSQTAFTLSRTVNSVNDVEVLVNNVEQQPNSTYTISGTTLTFTTAPSSGTNNIYVRYLSTVTQSIAPSQNTVQYSSLNSDNQSKLGITGKNRIINSNMAIDQRNNGASVSANNNYTLDRWTNSTSQAGKFTVQQNANSVALPAGFTYYQGAVSTAATSVGSTDLYTINQFIEGYNVADLSWGTSNAKSVTLSFLVQSSLTGTFGGSITNSALNRSYPFSYSIPVANTWTQIAITIPGDTTGTWLTTNGIGMRIFFSLGSGTSQSGTAGSWAGTQYVSATGAVSVVGTSGATWYVTGVQLEVGTQATQFTTAGGSYGAELALCQRYFEIIQPGQATAGNASSSVAFLNGSFQVQKRAAPTMGGGSGIQVRLYASTGGAGSYTGSGIAATNYVNTGGYEVQVSGFSGLSNVFGVFQSATTNFTASAEL